MQINLILYKYKYKQQNYMFEEQKDQRQYLKNKIKQLEQQIVERARNYMQSSRSRVRNTLSLPSPHALMANKQIQTDQLALTNFTDQTDTNQQSKGYQVGQFDQWLKQYLKSWNLLQKCINLSGENNNKQDSFASPQAKINQILAKKRCIVLQTIDKIITLFSSKSQVQCLTLLTLQLEQFKQVYVKSDQSLREYLSEYCNVERQMKREGEKNRNQEKIKQLEQSLQQLKFQISNMQNRCNFIKKALNQSQQQNYQLRLKLQQNDIKLRNINQALQKDKNEKQRDYQLFQQLKNKVQKLETIKKEYLRAYTRVKQQKEQIQIKNMQLQQRMQKLKTTLANQRSIYSSMPTKSTDATQMNIMQIEQVQEQDMRLKTIIQHSQDQLIEEVMRHTSSGNSLNMIKEIIEHGLMETNRSTSEKWIKSALIKLDEFEQLREEEQQKMIQSQNNLQHQIHQKYRILITNLVKLISKDQYTMQHNFNRMMDKIIGQNKLNLIAKSQQKYNQNDNITQIILKNMKTSSQQLQTSNIAQTQQIKKQIAIQTLELVSKLNEYQQRYKDLKRMYDELLNRQQIQNVKSKYNSPKKMENDFEKFMDKIVKNYHLTQSDKIYKQSPRFTQSFFDKLSLRLFQILCNFPTGTHGQVFFIPASQQELEDAVEVLYKFSLEFDKFQEFRLKQFKSEAKGLTKVLEQIAIANEVPPEVVIQSMNNNLDTDNTMSSPYVKSLIKKLSQQKITKKQKQLSFNEKSKLETQQLQMFKQSI